MASSRAWLLSLVMAGGVVGGGTMALQSAAGAPSASKPTAPVAQSQPVPSTHQLDAQIRRLLKQDKALRDALAEARRQFEGELLAAAPAALPQPAAAPATRTTRRHVTIAVPAPQPAESRPAPPKPAPTHQAKAPAPAPRASDHPPASPPPSSPPPTHGTTGASGAGGGDDGHDGGGDD